VRAVLPAARPGGWAGGSRSPGRARPGPDPMPRAPFPGPRLPARYHRLPRAGAHAPTEPAGAARPRTGPPRGERAGRDRNRVNGGAARGVVPAPDRPARTPRHGAGAGALSGDPDQGALALACRPPGPVARPGPDCPPGGKTPRKAGQGTRNHHRQGPGLDALSTCHPGPCENRFQRSMSQTPSTLPDFSRPPFAGAPEARVEPLPADGVLPEGFFSTSNLPTYVHVGGQWLAPIRPRMDCVIVRRNGMLEAIEPRRLGRGEEIAMGEAEDGTDGIVVHGAGFL